MKKLISVILVLVLLAGYIPTNAADTSAKGLTVEEQVNEIISNMTIEEKLAQMMIVALRDDPKNTHAVTKLTKDYKKILKKYNFGGIILFSKNIVDIKQTVTLIRDSQKAAMSSKQGIPMLMCVDQEGGLVNRVSFGITSSGNMNLAATGDTECTYESALMIGEEIKSLGFNVDFAPVSDVNNNPANPIIGARSFSDDPEIVSKNVIAFIQGLKANNIAASVKHFPGHGNVGADSHTSLPLSELTIDEMKECELIPFKAGIDAGADMIMTAHIQYPNVETKTYTSKEDGQQVYLPATLSDTIMTGLLREDLGYDGIIVTDAMDMGAITSHFGDIDAAVMTINAGVDILLCNLDIYKDDEVDTMSYVKTYMKKLAARVKAGDIDEKQLDDSVARILKLKFEYGIMENPLQVSKKAQLKKVKKVMGSEEHRTREWEISQKGMTLLKNNDSMFPINGNEDNTLILIPVESCTTSMESALARLESEGLADTSKVSIVSYNGLTKIDKSLKKEIKNADNILILSKKSSKNELVNKIIDRVHKTSGKKVALVSLGLPYDVACYEGADAVICALNPYRASGDTDGKGPFNLNEAVVICTTFGLSVPNGTLPVNIPKITVDAEGKVEYLKEILYERGSGLKNWGKKDNK